jgi:general secretion pathway protein K
MTRRGFALLTVLWLIAGLGAITAASLALARVGAGVSRNRILLIRAAWARNACEEILLARYAERRRVGPLDSTDLGGGVWCAAAVEEAGTRLDLNRAAPEALGQLLGNDSLADALLDWRDPDDVSRPHGAEREWYAGRGRRTPRNGPFADPAELRWVRGFDSATVQRLEPLLTTSGEVTVDLNAAPAAVLASLPGLDAQAVAMILGRRASVPWQSSDELLALLSHQSRATLLNRYQEFAGHAAYGRSAAYGPSRVVLRVHGAAGRPALVAGERLTVIPVPGRLAVIRREIR